jgi:hypothetical protein
MSTRYSDRLFSLVSKRFLLGAQAPYHVCIVNGKQIKGELTGRVKTSVDVD